MTQMFESVDKVLVTIQIIAIKHCVVQGGRLTFESGWNHIQIKAVEKYFPVVLCSFQLSPNGYLVVITIKFLLVISMPNHSERS